MQEVLQVFPGAQRALELRDPRLHAGRGREGVAAGRELDADAGGRAAVLASLHRVGLAAELDLGHVAQAHERAVRVGEHHRRRVESHRGKEGGLRVGGGSVTVPVGGGVGVHE